MKALLDTLESVKTIKRQSFLKATRLNSSDIKKEITDPDKLERIRLVVNHYYDLHVDLSDNETLDPAQLSYLNKTALKAMTPKKLSQALSELDALEHTLIREIEKNATSGSTEALNSPSTKTAEQPAPQSDDAKENSTEKVSNTSKTHHLVESQTAAKKQPASNAFCEPRPMLQFAGIDDEELSKKALDESSGIYDSDADLNERISKFLKNTSMTT